MKTIDQVTLVSSRDQQLLRDIKAIVHASIPSARVLLYGSVARGTQDSESDYDILVLTDHPMSRWEQNEIRGLVFDWEVERGVVVSMLFRSMEEWDSPLTRVSPFRCAVEKDALAL